MNESRNILDAPVTTNTGTDLQPDYTAASSLDYSINVFLLVISGLACASALVDSSSGFFIMMMWNLVLGGYQLLSAFVGAIRGNYKKGYYLAGAIAYLLLLFAGTTSTNFGLNGDQEMIFAGIFYVFLPVGGAVYYTTLCLEAKNRGRNI
ncbi:MAG: hypothetical protein AAFP77_15480 [Bacteroidota bacterium]